MSDKHFVYILRSGADPNRHYTGITSDVEKRLHWHNTGRSGVTVHHRPWAVVVSLAFADARVASRFERYLKTGSGRAFAKRHFGEHIALSGERPTTRRAATEHAVSPARQNLEHDRRHHDEQEDRHQDR